MEASRSECNVISSSGVRRNGKSQPELSGGGKGAGGRGRGRGQILNAIANCHESSEQLTEENHAIKHYYI